MPVSTRRSAASAVHPHIPLKSLLDAPPEVVFAVLANLDPVDVAALSQTSRALHAYTAPTNALLWRTLFLNLFDLPDPEQTPIGDYCTCVKDRCKARGIVRAPHRYKQAKERPLVLRTLHNILVTTPRSLPFAASKNAACLETLLASKSAIHDWLIATPPWKHSQNQDSDALSSLPVVDTELDRISSHLHLAGMSMREVGWLTYKAGQPFREEIYRGSNFDETNMFGPYLKPETANGPLVIDWHMLNAIATVMALNVHGAWHQWGEESEQETLPYGFSRAVFWRSPDVSKDWACVTGRWNYIYAFIDYNDFFAYNFAPTSLQGQNNDLEGISEAVGGINSLELALAPVEEQDWDSYPDDPFPPLKFVGQSTGPTGSTFRGLVKMLDNGYRHWEFTIHYSGSDRWQTSGVEVGGRGVYGIWSDVLHEDLSPCGPVWYFRS